MVTASLCAMYFILGSFGLLKIKQAETVLSFVFFSGMMLYGMSFFVWLIIARRLPISIAFPICSGGLLVMSQIIGYFLLGELFSTYKCIAVLMIAIAIILLAVDMNNM